VRVPEFDISFVMAIARNVNGVQLDTCSHVLFFPAFFRRDPSELEPPQPEEMQPPPPAKHW